MTQVAQALPYGLVNFWSFSSSSLKDLQTGLSLTNPTSYSLLFGADHATGRLSSSIYLNGNNYLQLPSATYFSGYFTITAWVNIWGTTNPYPRIIDCGVSYWYTNSITLFWSSNLMPGLQVYVKPSSTIFYSTKAFTLNTWGHIAAVYGQSANYIYMNGVVTGLSSYMISYPIVTRTNCYIGHSGNGDPNSKSYFDDIVSRLLWKLVFYVLIVNRLN